MRMCVCVVCVCVLVNLKNLKQANSLLHFVFYFKRLSSLLIITQLVNQATEVVIPFLVDRLLSAPQETESKDKTEEGKLRNQSSRPDYPVSICPSTSEYQNTAQPLYRPCD